uniref:Uncharacterized protein n=1 Tax=Cacopsylla melanoneura TaxID=428564 RepID=A0A8D9BNK7_9HEMI
MSKPLQTSLLYLFRKFSYLYFSPDHFISYPVQLCHSTTPSQHLHLSNFQPLFLHFLYSPGFCSMKHRRPYNRFINFSLYFQAHSLVTQNTGHSLPVHPPCIHSMCNLIIQISHSIHY